MSGDNPPVVQEPKNFLTPFGDVQENPTDSSIDVQKFQEYFEASRSLEMLLGKKFMHKVKELDSALALSKASEKLFKSFAEVRDYLEDHGGQLDALQQNINANFKDEKNVQHKTTRRGKKKQRSTHRAALLRKDFSKGGDYRGVFDNLHLALETFSTTLVYFDDYKDAELMTSLKNVNYATMELHDILEFFRDDPNSDELREFVVSRTTSMTINLKSIHESLDSFISVGIPCIGEAQKREALKLNNSAFIATFFASVVSGTLQLTNTDNTRQSSVLSAANTLLLTALVFAIAAAFNSMLAITVQKTLFARPGLLQPKPIRLWIKQSHIWFLGLAVSLFLLGLVALTFHTQKRGVAWVILIFTLFSALGLAMISIWLLSENRYFSRLAGTQEMRQGLQSKLWDWISAAGGKSRSELTETTEKISWSRSWKDNGKAIYAVITRYFPILSYSWHKQTWANADQSGRKPTEEEPKEPGPSTDERRDRSDSQSVLSKRSRKSQLRRIRSQHFQNYIDLLKDSARWKCLAAFDKEHVKHLRFSPNGRWLAVCFVHECQVYDVLNGFKFHQTLWHFGGKHAEQVEWSPNGSMLTTRIANGVRLWVYDINNNKFDHPKDRYYDFKEPLAQIEWVNDEVFLVLLDDLKSADTFYKVNVKRSKAGYTLPKEIDFTDIYSLDHAERVICIASRDIKNGYRSVDCLIVYNMTPPDSFNNGLSGTSVGKIEGKIPLINNARTLAVSKDGKHILVSYETKPPEIWRVTDNATRIVRSFSLHFPQKKFMRDGGYWGEAFFTGPDEDVVGCLYDGKIHFWRLDSKDYVGAQSFVDEKDEFTNAAACAWNFTSHVPMMACCTNTKNSKLQIWGHREDRLPDTASLASSAKNVPAPSNPKETKQKTKLHVFARLGKKSNSAVPASHSLADHIPETVEEETSENQPEVTVGLDPQNDVEEVPKDKDDAN